MKIKTTLAVPALLIILFSLVFYAFASTPLFDFDFWWHIATGRQIVETHKLPDADSFSYTSGLSENKNLFPEREKFILKQYWLGQIIFYYIYNSTGPKGIIILRAVILTSLILLVFYRLRKWNVSPHISFIFVFLLFTVAMKNIGERPVLFTILFTPLTFIILEGFKDQQKKILLLPPLMLLWSNLHGGFIIGNIIIISFMLGEGIKIIFKKAAYTRSEITFFYSTTTMAFIFSFINPTGWDAFSIALSSEYKFMEAGIQEYASPLFLYKEKLYPPDYVGGAILLFFPLIFILRNRKIDITHIIILSGFFIMAMETTRFVVYYASLASMVLARETDSLLKDFFKKRLTEGLYAKTMYAFSFLAVMSAILYFYGSFMKRPLDFGIATGYSVPKAAVDFIEENKIKGNMMNDAGYGGYIAWRLYPWKKTFIDTRWLNYTVKSEWSWVINARDSLKGNKIAEGKLPLWERLLEHYNVNFSVFALFDVYGQVMEIVLKLTESDTWVPVYSDIISIIFIKNTPENQAIIAKYRQTNENVYNIIIARACLIAQQNESNPKSLLSLGKTFYKMGKLNEAITAYQYALERSPHKKVIKQVIDHMESELKEKNKDEKH